MEAYFIVDDAIGSNGKEGFLLLYGDPFEAVGTVQGQSALRRDVVKLVPDGEPIYRVKVARRHGEFRVTKIKTR